MGNFLNSLETFSPLFISTGGLKVKGIKPLLENPIKQRLKLGKPSFGLLSNLPSPHLTEIFGIAGFDFIIFDMEHSTISEETLESLIRAAKIKGLVPMARVRENNPRSILGALDAGCLGVMIPQIESKEEAEEAVESTKYPPLGKRGINWKTVAGEWGTLNPAEYVKAANDNILTMLQIETVKGLEKIEEIAEVKGIDVVIIGPSDLSASMGYPGNPAHWEVKKAVNRIMEAVNRAGIALGGAESSNKEMMEEAQRKGVLIFIANPVAFITESCKELVSKIKITFICPERDLS